MIRREMYLKKLEMYLDRDVVKIITGVRRCGKTTIVRQFIDELKAAGVPEGNILYVDFESIRYAYFTHTEDLRNLLVSFIENTSGRCYLFLDEPQGIERWSQVASELLNLHDADIYVIASNSGIFHEGFARTLSYRYVRIDVFPLTFGEYLELTADEPGHNPGNAATAVQDDDFAGDGREDEEYTEYDEDEASHVLSREELFVDYLRRGCMPGIYSLKSNADISDYIGSLYNTIILKDVVQCNKLRDISHLDKIMEYILSHMGETFSPKGIKDYVKQRGVTISVDTVYSFLDALTGAFLIYKLPRYDVKSDRELETQEKYYICDMGMRNAVMKDEGASYKTLLESALYLELLVRGFRIYVAKYNQNQVEFMAVRGNDRTYLNTCVTVEDKAAAKAAFGPLTRIRDNYFKMVLSMDRETKINKGGIINYPIVDFLSQE